MKKPYDPNTHFASLQLPAQDLAKLSFCDSTKASRIQDWVDQLQVTRVTQTSVHLYRCLPEISRVQVDPKTRLDMLESLRLPVQNNIAGLARQFLGQPLILPPAAQKAAIIAQSLQKMMIDGYSICVRDLIKQKSASSAQGKANLTKAIYRAITGIGLLYFRSCQIYTQIPKGFWLHLHNLFRTAERLKLSDTQVQDDLLKHGQTSSIKQAYLRVIMLACSRSNQLSQQDLTAAFAAFEAWSQYVEIHEYLGLNNHNQFVINLSHDEPPSYKTRYQGDKNDFLMELDLSQLTTALQWQKTEGTSNGKKGIIATPMPAGLVNHLLDTWSQAVDRQQQRSSVNKEVEICVGLTECHYHLAGEQNFSDFLKRVGDSSPGGRTRLLTGTAGSFKGERSAQAVADKIPAPLIVAVTNISEGGYCLYWQNSIPSNVTAGQLLGVRDQGQTQWHLGVVRWIKQLKSASQMGVQILAREAEPVATSMRYDRGGYSDFMRAFYVSPPAFDQTSATLITAAAPFHEFGKTRLKSDGQVQSLQLDQCVFGTNTIRQFGFHLLDADLDRDETVGMGVEDDIDPESLTDAEVNAASAFVPPAPTSDAPLLPPDDGETVFDSDRDWD